MIAELEARIEMLNEEIKVQQIKFDRRLNDVIREFLGDKKKYNEVFDSYKMMISVEVTVHEQVRVKLENIIEKYFHELKEVKTALRIPRQHFKIMEQMNF